MNGAGLKQTESLQLSSNSIESNGEDPAVQ